MWGKLLWAEVAAGRSASVFSFSGNNQRFPSTHVAYIHNTASEWVRRPFQRREGIRGNRFIRER